MKIVFFGTPQFVVPVLETLTQHYDVVAVVTAPDKKVGRKQLLTSSPIKQFGVKYNIPVFTPENLSSFNSQFSTLNSDLLVIAAYGKIIPKPILDLPKFGAINIHPSPLPKYRGPSPITTTILHGDNTSAISFMLLDEQMDHGPILKMVPYDIPADATSESLTHDIFATGAKLLPEVINDYVAGKITPTPQDGNEATYTKIITKQDGYVDLSSLETLNLEEIVRKIRAYYPWPTVWSKIRIKNKEVRIKLLPSSSLRGTSETRNAAIASRFLIQLEGGKPMSIKNFLNGYPEMKKILEPLILNS